MKCVYCGGVDSKVIDSRSTDEQNSIRRRRECLVCTKRFTTYEVVEHTPIMVVKNNGNRQAFDITKIKSGIIKSCEKRPVAMQQIDALVADIEKQIVNLEQEIKSSRIGDIVMAGLKDLDDVAYIRFAAVYRQFKDVTEFADFIQKVKG